MAGISTTRVGSARLYLIVLPTGNEAFPFWFLILLLGCFRNVALCLTPHTLRTSTLPGPSPLPMATTSSGATWQLAARGSGTCSTVRSAGLGVWRCGGCGDRLGIGIAFGESRITFNSVQLRHVSFWKSANVAAPALLSSTTTRHTARWLECGFRAAPRAWSRAARCCTTPRSSCHGTLASSPREESRPTSRWDLWI